MIGVRGPSSLCRRWRAVQPGPQAAGWTPATPFKLTRHPRAKSVATAELPVASISAMMGQPYNTAYCASKGGVLLAMRALAIELADRGIRVNCVSPGGIDTPMINDAAHSLPEDAKPGDTIRCCGRTYRLTFEYGAFAAEEP